MNKIPLLILFLWFANPCFAQKKWSSISSQGELHIPLPTHWENTTDPGELHIFFEENKPQDTKPPVITFTGLLRNSDYITVTQKQFRINGYASDESGISIVYLTGEDTKVSENTNFNFRIILREGENKFVIKAKDKSVNANETEHNITINYKAPKQKIIAGKNYALFFAVNDYKGIANDLKNPISDAEAIASSLKNTFGFDTTIVRNPTKEEILLKIQDYQNKKYNDKDQVFIHFSGHGYASDQGYFLPADADFNAQTEESYWSFATMALKITAIPCRHILLVLDACYSSVFSEDVLFGNYYVLRKVSPRPPVESSELQDFVDNTLKKQSRWVITASVNSIADGKNHSKLTENFIGSDEEEGAFTKYANNNNTDQVLQFDELRSYIKEHNTDAKFRTFQKHQKDGNFLFIVK